MEVASPLTFGSPTPAGSKRPLTCAPPVIGGTSSRNALSEMSMEESLQRSTKRRRCGDASVESLSNAFSMHSPFFQNGQLGNAGHSLKRSRIDGSASPVKDLSPLVEEQASQITLLKKDKTNLEADVSSLKNDNTRLTKENQLLRRAVTIQQDRQKQAEKDLKDASDYRAGAEVQMRKLEQVILSLRYHLQAQQTNIGNTFMERRPPDVY